MAGKEIINAQNIRRSFTTEEKTIDILRGVDFAVKEGEIIGIVGASGSGKSTLLHILGGLDRPTGGSVAIDGEDFYTRNDEERSSVRGRKVGFVFQFHHLLSEFNALENVMIPAMIETRSGVDGAIRDRATELLTSVGLGDRLYHRPGKLSGGEQQRTALARALINKPSLLLADEPTGNLDEKTADGVFAILKNLAQEKKLATVVVTHNFRLAELMDSVYELHEGMLQARS
jgi:lipoprotein-releasing system ATP-binding protein